MPPAKKVDATKFCQEVALGRHDADLKNVMAAVGQRFLDSGRELRWRVTVAEPAIEFDEDTVTVGVVERAERITGRSWLVLDPRRRQEDVSALCRAWLESQGMSADEAADAVRGLPSATLAAAITEYEADRPFDPTESPTS